MERRHHELGIGAGRQQLAHEVELRHRRAVLSEVEVRRCLHLQEPRTQLERQRAARAEAALGHAQHLLVAPAQVQHLAQAQERATLALQRAGAPRPLQHVLVRALALVPAAERRERVCARQRQHGRGLALGRRRVVQELQERARPALAQQHGRHLEQQLVGELGVQSVQGVARGALGLAAPAQHARGRRLQGLPRPRPLARLHLLADERAHETVPLVARLGPRAVAAHEPAPGQGLEPGARITLPGEQRRQRRVEAVEHGRALEQLARGRLEPAVDLRREERLELQVRHAQVGEHGVEPAGGLAAERLERQLHRGRPAGRCLVQAIQLRLDGRPAERALEQRCHLLAGEPQATGVQLEQLAPHAHALERERRRRARCGEHAHLRGQEPQQRVEERDDVGVRARRVQVVEHEEARRTLELCERLREHRAQELRSARAGPRVLDEARERGPEARRAGTEALEQVAPEHAHVAVRGQEPVPHDRTVAAADERRGERGLAPARVCGQQRERTPRVTVEELEQRRSLECGGIRVRNLELGAGERDLAGIPPRWYTAGHGRLRVGRGSNSRQCDP